MIKKLFKKYREIIMYIIVGGLTTFVNWIAYAVCVISIPIETEERLVFVSNLIAWIVAVLFAYVTNKRWVFESKTNGIKELFREFVAFIGARVLTGVMEIAGVPLLVMMGLNQKLFGIDGFPAKIIFTVVVMVLNYVFSKLLIFKKAD